MEELKKVFLRPVGEVALPILTSKGPLRNLQNQNCSWHHCVESICLRLPVSVGTQIKSVTYVHMRAIRELNSSQL